jgi:hypothetical protein
MATMKWKKAVMTMAASTRKRMNIVMMPTSKATTKMTMTMIAIKMKIMTSVGTRMNEQ